MKPCMDVHVESPCVGLKWGRAEIIIKKMNELYNHKKFKKKEHI